MLQETYGKNSLYKTQIFPWHKDLKSEREYIGDEQCAKHPSSSQTSDNVAKIKAFLDSNTNDCGDVGTHKTDCGSNLCKNIKHRKFVPRSFHYILQNDSIFGRTLKRCPNYHAALIFHG